MKRYTCLRFAVLIYVLLITCALLWWTSITEQQSTVQEWFLRDYSSPRSVNHPSSTANTRKNLRHGLPRRKIHSSDKTQAVDKLHQEASCEGNFIGYDHTFAQLTNLVINPKNGKGRRGGENCSDVFNQSEKSEYYEISYGYFELLCTSKSDYAFNRKSHLNHWQEVLKTTNEIQKPGKINHGWTIAVVRYEYANLYHTMTDYYNAFFVTKMFNIKPGNITILWIDGHPSGALDETWSVLFGNVLRAGDLEKPEMFSHMIWGIMGYDSHLNNHKNKNVPYLDEFRSFFLSRHGISTLSRLNCSELNIMFLWRRDYLAHPRNPSGSVSRKIKNEKELLDSAKKAFPNHKVFGVQIDKFNMKRQLDIIAGIDILIGMHGAGLTHTLFLPPHAGLIELYPTYWSNANRHFVSMATWRKLHYLSWVNIDSTKELPDHFTVVDVGAVTALIGKMEENKVCLAVMYSYVTKTCLFLKSNEVLTETNGSYLFAGDHSVEGWVKYHGSFYLFEKQELKWADAVDFCRAIGATLAELETEGENNFLQAYLRIIDHPKSWIGMTNIDQEDVWVLANGTTANYTDWAEGQPSHGPSANCCAMFKELDYKWVDVNCSHKMFFICERVSK